ncbi:DDB1- and CUL4-associated factor 5 isoform X2 [Phymastichus coffea]|uniref:DDB1- and CUL4-associated factor 5 isoform X2 n=1 Tax=Phymastichus coffea TaxID=108790 RepID=UPI00273C3B50|nr:DDB1- and CUL4-associated factor 5 isoform X2 [Phymastichus coffea]
MWNRKVFIRIIEVLLCIACVIALRVTDDESRRVFHYLRNRSREWSLLNNVTWGAVGSAFSSATCAGYLIVTIGLLIAAASGELRGRKTEVFFLGLGVILFGIVGGLALSSIDSVPIDLIDNAVILGVLCLVTALVFIADMLMKPRYKKKKHDATQTTSAKEQGKQYVTTTTMTINSEKEKQSSASGTKHVTSWRSPTPEMTEKHNSMNGSATDLDDEREHRLERAERQMREYSQNIENGRGDRNGRAKQSRDQHDMSRKSNSYYREDVYQRPVDEVDDAPPFPTNSDERPVFAKMVNPGVKIMRVERDEDRGYDNYRLSDSSQYDNVPTRMRGSSPGILKRQRDVSFEDRRRSRGSRPSAATTGTAAASQRDEIAMLEECFDALRTSTTTTTATQTTTNAAKSSRQSHTPASPNDPGFVRHAASNWPHLQSNPVRDR